MGKMKCYTLWKSSPISFFLVIQFTHSSWAGYQERFLLHSSPKGVMKAWFMLSSPGGQCWLLSQNHTAQLSSKEWLAEGWQSFHVQIGVRSKQSFDVVGVLPQDCSAFMFNWLEHCFLKHTRQEGNNNLVAFPHPTKNTAKPQCITRSQAACLQLGLWTLVFLTLCLNQSLETFLCLLIPEFPTGMIMLGTIVHKGFHPTSPSPEPVEGSEPIPLRGTIKWTLGGGGENCRLLQWKGWRGKPVSPPPQICLWLFVM